MKEMNRRELGVTLLAFAILGAVRRVPGQRTINRRSKARALGVVSI